MEQYVPSSQIQGCIRGTHYFEWRSYKDTDGYADDRGGGRSRHVYRKHRQGFEFVDGSPAINGCATAIGKRIE